MTTIMYSTKNQTLLRDIHSDVHLDKTVSDKKDSFFSQVSFNSKNIVRIILLLISTLLIIELALLYLKYYLNFNAPLFRIIEGFFDFDKEANFPTLLSSVLLLFASLTLLFLYKTAPTKKYYWLLLSSLFLFLCFDEATQIHEKFDKIKSRLEPLNDSILVHVWVLPYLLLILLLIFFLKSFIFNLPAKTRNLFILSGIIFVGGAVGLEIIEGQLKVLNQGEDNLTLDVLYCIEEVCEMIGVTIFIYALLDYIAPKRSSIFIMTRI